MIKTRALFIREIDILTVLSYRGWVMPFRPYACIRRAGLLLLFLPMAVFGQFSPPPFNYAVYATGTGCGAINMSGSAYTDSFDSSKGNYKQTKQSTGGNVGVSGNINLSGSATINGTISALNINVGSCPYDQKAHRSSSLLPKDVPIRVPRFCFSVTSEADVPT